MKLTTIKSVAGAVSKTHYCDTVLLRVQLSIVVDALCSPVRMVVLDSVVDIFFFIDIIFNFHTSFVGTSGEVVTDQNKIKRYVVVNKNRKVQRSKIILKWITINFDFTKKSIPCGVN